MMERLDVILYGYPVATLDRRGPSDYLLTYERSWQESEGAPPVSLSLPISQRVHSGRVVYDFVDNLLPDSTAQREEWARKSLLSDAEVFGLLAIHGRDVAGALEFYPVGEPRNSEGSLEPASAASIADRIRAIRENRPLPTEDVGLGQFSLGGAQGKFALARRDAQWWEPSGTEPSTHIFKPQVMNHPDAEIVEHVVMSAAALLGVPVAATQMVKFENEHTLQVQRFDRTTAADEVVRIHQEDLSQALGVPRLRKYEKDGGPGYRDVIKLLKRIDDPAASRDSLEGFVKGLIYSWLVLNTDAHSKNFSLWLLPEGARLTPLYDVSSFLPYLKPHEPGDLGLLNAIGETQLAMKVAGSYSVASMGRFEWEAVTRDAGLNAPALLQWAVELCELAPRAFRDVVSQLSPEFQTDIVALLVERMGVRVAQAKKVLTRDVHV